jgi:uncharacterized delta-60 repeat protein/CSLREA domain-containing protein
VVGGYSYTNKGVSFALVRYTTSGTLDTTFGTSGKVITDPERGYNYLQALALQADNKIIAAGSAAGTTSDFALVRYNTNGTPDSSFGSSGIVTTPFGSGDDQAYAVTIQSNGRIVAAGSANMGATSEDFALARYIADALQLGSPIKVNVTADHDDGACTASDCTLREAINYANAHPATTIGFYISTADGGYNNPPSGDTANVFTLRPTTPLPALTANGTIIDGYTQPGATTNTLLTGNNAVFKIQLSGANAGASTAGITINASSCRVRGLVINRFGNGAVRITGNTSLVIGCTIGTDATRTLSLPNSVGVVIAGTNNIIGSAYSGIAASSANVIADNTGAGVQIVSGNGNPVRGNSIYDNGRLGIDLVGGSENASGVTANDLKDTDVGANTLQNYPVITGVTSSGTGIAFSGTLNSVPSSTFAIDFYLSPTADASGFGEGRTYLGSTTVTTDSSGNATFSNVAFNGTFTAPTFVSATATSTGSNTSEFSATKQALYFIRGRITNDGNTGVANVSVKCSGVAASTLTDSSGNYAFAVPPGTFTVTPTLPNYTFSPTSQAVTVTNSDVTGIDFRRLFLLAGIVTDGNGARLDNITITLNTGASTTTDGSGNYAFSNLPAATYTVTPSFGAYSFMPHSRTVTLNIQNLRTVNFTGGYYISGRVVTSAMTGIGGVTITLSGRSTPVVTSSAGYYTFYGVLSGSYTLTPSLSGYSFTPPSKSVTVANSSLINQNFIGSSP